MQTREENGIRQVIWPLLKTLLELTKVSRREAFDIASKVETQMSQQISYLQENLYAGNTERAKSDYNYLKLLHAKAISIARQDRCLDYFQPMQRQYQESIRRMHQKNTTILKRLMEMRVDPETSTIFIEELNSLYREYEKEIQYLYGIMEWTNEYQTIYDQYAGFNYKKGNEKAPAQYLLGFDIVSLLERRFPYATEVGNYPLSMDHVIFYYLLTDRLFKTNIDWNRMLPN